MSRNIDVNLRFNAETNGVKKQLNDLKTTLYDLGSVKIDIKGGNIDEATQSARKLFDALQDATDVDTGKLDFSKLDCSLKKSNTSLSETSRHLLNLGPQGTKAFGQLAGAIANSEDSIHKMNGTLQKFIDTMASNLMWGASNMIIDGIKQGVQDAIKHIEKLDKSLTNIKIVTGQSNAQMQAFAKQANEAARALKATTTEYTDASLIYFQQGLAGEDVTKRTDATIKMAKVTGDSVQEVSNQLTSIWNNFADGSSNLEYYVDVITALGAATASSTDEIATGLEKFSSVAETVGLSYEYATAALATVTSETRQSAEVVGTAFKTLFSRMQDLELGKTLDDGTTIGTYSKALAKVGIDIKDQNGELKAMDKILDEMGAKWNTISKDQQVALAQAVGGVRQYNQLIALMDNYDKMQQNVAIAKNSEGTLEKQFDAAKDSIESLDKELENVKEKLYQQIFNADMIKDFKKILIDIVETISRIIDSAGGLKGLLTFGGLFAVQALLPKLQGGIGKLVDSFKDMSGYTSGKKMVALTEMEKQITGKDSTELADTWKIRRKNKDEVPGQEGGTSKNSEKTSFSTAAGGATTEADAAESSTPTPATPISASIKDENSLIAASNEMQGQIIAKQKERLIMSDLLTEKQKEQFKAYNDQLQAQKNAVDVAAQEKLAAEEKLELIKKQGVQEQENIKRRLEAREKELGGRKAELDAEDAEDDATLEAIEADDSKTQAQKDAAKKIRDARKAKRKTERESIEEEEADIASKIGTKEDRAAGKKKMDFSGAAMERQKGIVEDTNDVQASGLIDSGLEAAGLGTESGVPAANLETAQKLGELQQQYVADSQTANTLAQELNLYQNQIAAAGAKTAGEIVKGNKEEEKMKKVSGEVAKTLKQYKSVLNDGSKEGQKLLQLLEKMDKEGEEFDLAGLSKEELDLVQKGMGKISKTTKNAADQAEGWGEAIATDAAAVLGGNAEGFAKIGDATGEVKTKIQELDEEKQKFDEGVKNPPYGADPFGSLTQGATQVVGGLTNLQMSYTTFHAGMTTVMDEEASGFEKIMGVVGMASSAMTLYNGVMSIGQGIMTIINGLKGVFAVVTGKETAATLSGIPAVLANTGAKIANAIATVLCVEASKGLAGVVTGVLAVGMIVGAAAIGIATMNSINNAKALEEDAKQAEKDAAASAENAEASKDAAKAKQEEYEKVKQLSDEYEELYSKYKNGLATSDDLIAKAKEMAIALGDESLYIMAQRGEYEELLKVMKQVEAEKQAESVEAARQSETDAVTNFQNQLIKAQTDNKKSNDGKLKVDELDTGMEYGTHSSYDKKFYVNIGPGEEDADALFWKTKVGEGKELYGWKAVKDGKRGYGYVYMGDGNPVADWEKLNNDFVKWFNEQQKLGAISKDVKISDAETYNKTVQMKNGTVGSAAQGALDANETTSNTVMATYTDSVSSGMNFGEYMDWANTVSSNEEIDETEFSTTMLDNEEYGDWEFLRKYLQNKNLSEPAKNFLKSSPFLTMASKYGASAAIEMAEKAGVFSGIYDNSKTAMADMANAMKMFEGSASTLGAIEWDEKTDDAIVELRDTKAAGFDAKKFFADNKWLYTGENALFSSDEIMDYYNYSPDELSDEIAARQAESKYTIGGISSNAASGSSSDGNLSATPVGAGGGGSAGRTMVFAPKDMISAEKFFGKGGSSSSSSSSSEGSDEETEVAAYNWLLEQNDILTDEKKEYLEKKTDHEDKITAGSETIDTFGMNQIEISALENTRIDSLASNYSAWQSDPSLQKFDSIIEFARYLVDNGESKELEEAGIVSGNAIFQAKELISKLDAKSKKAGFKDYSGLKDAEGMVYGESETAVDAFTDYQIDSITETNDKAWKQYTENQKAKQKELAATYEISEEYVSEYAKSLKKADETGELTTEMATDLAREILISSRATESFSKNWKNYGQVIKDNKRDTEDWMNASKALKKDLSAIMEVDEALITDDMLTDMSNKGILDLISQGEGIEEARGYIVKELFGKSFEEAGLSEQFNSLIDQATAEANDLEIGASIDSAPFMQSLAEMMMAQGASAEQMQEMFDKLGWSGEIATVDLLGNETVTETGEIYRDGELIGKTTASLQAGATGKIPVMLPKEGGGFTWGKDIKFDGGSKGVKKSDGGGGGSKKKKVEDEIERYHEIQETIDDLSAAYDRLSDAKDRAFGKSKLDLMDQELAKKKELIEAQKEYIKEIEENLENDMAYAKGVGVEIDLETGRVINYDEIIAKWVEDYNAGKMSDEEFDDAKKFLDQYEETLNLYEEEIQNLFDQQNEYLTAQLDNISVEIEMDVRVLDSDLNLIEYHFEHLEDTIHDSVKAITLLTDKTNNLMMKSLSYQEGIKDVLSIVDAEGNHIFNDAEVQALLAGDMSVLNGKDLTTEQLEALEEYSQNLLDLNNELIGIYDTIGEKFSVAFSSVNEDLNEQIATMQHLGQVAQGYKDIVDLVGKDNFGISRKVLQDLNSAALNTSVKALESQKEVVEFNRNAVAETQALLDDAIARGDDLLADTLREQIKTMNQTLQESESTLMSSWSEALTQAQEMFAAAAQEALDTFEETMAGMANSFDDLQSHYDQYSDITKRYLEDYQEIYELSKLNREVEKQISNLDSIKAKEKLRDIQKEINKLQASGVKMSQYELDELRARYDLRVAEIALEEVQNAKNQVRMQRDSEGNWAYVYTTNQSQLDQAQQTYEDKLYAYQKVTQEYLTNIESQLISVPKEFADAVAQINEDLTLTEEERKEKLDNITKYYTEKYNYLLEELNKALEDSAELYDSDWKEYSKNTNYKISLEEDWRDTFEETFYAQEMGYKNIEQAQEEFKKATEKFLEDLEGYYRTWQSNLELIMQSVGSSIEGFANDIADTTERIYNDTEEARQSFISLAETGGKMFYGLVTEVREYSNKYGGFIQAMIEENVALAGSISEILVAMGENKIQSAYADWKKKVLEDVQEKKNIYDNYQGGQHTGGAGPNAGLGPDGPDDTGGNKGGWNGGAAEVGYIRRMRPTELDTYGRTVFAAYLDPYGSQSIMPYYQGGLGYAEFKILDYYYADNKGRYKVSFSTPLDFGGIKQTAVWIDEGWIDKQWGWKSSYDTGGYTGEWGDSSGRIAMLHQKEIVLNAKDTENFLAAVDIVREVARSIDLNAIAQSKGFGYLSAVSAVPTSQVVEQEVTIHAEFPNATDHNEIEEAFNNLVNRASQFANRKN